MPPRARNTDKDDEKPAEQVEQAEQADEKPDEQVETRDGICVRCWPGGWPSEDTKRASCEHGEWKR
jgi:hypothetical protein